MNKKEYGIFLMPLIISIICLLSFNYILKINEIRVNNFDMISNNYISFVSILVGFLITTISIVIGFFDKKIIKIIVRNKKEKVLYLNWFMTIATGIMSILVLFYIAGTFNDETMIVSKTPSNIFMFFMISFLIYLMSSLIYFFGIAKSVMNESVEDNIRNENVINKIDKRNIKTPKSLD